MTHGTLNVWNKCLSTSHTHTKSLHKESSQVTCTLSVRKRTNVCIALRLWFMQRMIFSLSTPARGYYLWIFIIAGALHAYFDNSDSFTFHQPSNNKRALKPFQGLCQGMQIVAILEQKRAQILQDWQWRRWLRAIREWYCPAGADCWEARRTVPFRPDSWRAFWREASMPAAWLLCNVSHAHFKRWGIMLPLSLWTLANEGKKWLLRLSCLEKLACYHRQMNTCNSDKSLLEVLNNVKIVICTELSVCACRWIHAWIVSACMCVFL